jgi:hypothetical protein
VHLPELALHPGRLGGARGREGVLVNLLERVVAEDEAEARAVVLLELLDDRVHPPARRALEVAELFEDDRRALGADGVRRRRARLRRAARRGGGRVRAGLRAGVRRPFGVGGGRRPARTHPDRGHDGDGGQRDADDDEREVAFRHFGRFGALGPRMSFRTHCSFVTTHSNDASSNV